MDIAHFELPTHWAVALMYGDDSIFEDNDEDFKSYSYFVDEMDRRYWRWGCIDVGDEVFFSFFHDATPFGVGGSECYKYTFDITKRA